MRRVTGVASPPPVRCRQAHGDQGREEAGHTDLEHAEAVGEEGVQHQEGAHSPAGDAGPQGKRGGMCELEFSGQRTAREGERGVLSHATAAEVEDQSEG